MFDSQVGAGTLIRIETNYLTANASRLEHVPTLTAGYPPDGLRKTCTGSTPTRTRCQEAILTFL